MPPPATTPKARDIWWATAGGGKVRHCVVLHADPLNDNYEIIYGQGANDSSGHHVEVRQGTFEGRMLKVSKDTYFRTTNVVVLPHKDFSAYIGVCPAGVFMRITQLINQTAAAAFSLTPPSPPPADPSPPAPAADPSLPPAADPPGGR